MTRQIPFHLLRYRQTKLSIPKSILGKVLQNTSIYSLSLVKLCYLYYRGIWIIHKIIVHVKAKWVHKQYQHWQSNVLKWYSMNNYISYTAWNNCLCINSLHRRANCYIIHSVCWQPWRSEPKLMCFLHILVSEWFVPCTLLSLTAIPKIFLTTWSTL